MQSNSKVSLKDKILLNLISTPISLRKKTSLDTLLRLEKKYSDCLDIKRKIVQFYLANNLHNDAINKLVFIVKQFMNETDIVQLIIHSFSLNLLEQIFFDFKHFQIIEKNSDYDFFAKALNLLRSKKLEINFERYINHLPISKDIKNSDYSYYYNDAYGQLIILAREGTFKEFFNKASKLFKVDGGFEVLEIMKKYQKIQILFYLSLRDQFIGKYFRETCEQIMKEFLLPLEVALSTKNYILLVTLCNFLKNKN